MKPTPCLLLVLLFRVVAPLSITAQHTDSLQKITQISADTFSHISSPAVKECPQKAIGELLRKKTESPPGPKKFMALIVPNISSNPSNGVILGLGGALGWIMGPKENTRASAAPFTLAATSKKQIIGFVKSNVYTKENKFFLQGDWRFYIYSQPTYGLGTNSPDSGDIPNSFHWEGEGGSLDSLSFPMKFNYIKFHEIVNRQVIGNFYAGIGYHLDYYYQIIDEKLYLDSTPQLLTPHYVYSKAHLFDTAHYMVSGLSLNLVYDSRDNLADPYKGIYANLNYRYNFRFLGSARESSSLWVEFRTYIGLSKKRARNLIGVWVFGDFNLSGNLPYLTLPAIGEDQRTRSGRGYTNGRYRGKNLVYGEVEWRFPISPCSQILGGVLFVNATTTDDPDQNMSLFGYIRPAVGVGLRVMVNKYFRTNINIDFAIGYHSKGIYFAGQETF
ncbi:MAG: outer membrane protein assembly factor [Bacteroidales bacterium]|nr:outer membrane protein assembly factor [Bacteroidales bacterium]